MNKLFLGYDLERLEFSTPPGLMPLIIDTHLIQPMADPLKSVTEIIGNSPDKLDKVLIKNAKTIAISINDKTRPVPHDILLPPLLDYLHKNGILQQNITFFISTGTHSPMSPEEFHKVLPEKIINQYQIISHDCDSVDDLEYIGTSKLGTPIYINNGYYSADIKIVVGNIEPHHFMGFSGGVKSASIGLTSRQTINANHIHLIDENSKTGNVCNNLCRIDVDEIGAIIGVDYALNVILNSEKQIVHILWGDPSDVMSRGVKLSSAICSIEVPNLFDCVIASAGGYPKDINLYQSQKALTNAASVTKDGGDVYLIASCREGLGNIAFEKFLHDSPSPHEVMIRFGHDGFSVGPHKAFQIAKIASRVNIHLLSTLEPELAQKCMFTPVTQPDISKLLSYFDRTKTLAVMPHAVTTIPMLAGD